MNSLPPLPSKAERHKRFGSVDPLPGTKPTTKEEMADLQNKSLDYLFAIDQVGIIRVKHPVTVLSSLQPNLQTSIAELALTTCLGQQAKGINMSRLTEQLELQRREGFSAELPQLCRLTEQLALQMGQEQAAVTLSFPWFYERLSPVSRSTGLNHAEVFTKVEYKLNKPSVITVGLTVSVTTLCPCSKEISEYSAHNQRGCVKITAVIHPEAISGDWKADLLYAAESNASAPLHPVLKRTDEKTVTEQAYENPRFVEDMVRLVAADLVETGYIESFTVECRNEESIHLHDAVARLSYPVNSSAIK